MAENEPHEAELDEFARRSQEHRRVPRRPSVAAADRRSRSSNVAVGPAGDGAGEPDDRDLGEARAAIDALGGAAAGAASARARARGSHELRQTLAGLQMAYGAGRPGGGAAPPAAAGAGGAAAGAGPAAAAARAAAAEDLDAARRR